MSWNAGSSSMRRRAAIRSSERSSKLVELGSLYDSITQRVSRGRRWAGTPSYGPFGRGRPSRGVNTVVLVTNALLGSVVTDGEQGYGTLLTVLGSNDFRGSP